jgi:hypothetical protein
MRLEASRVFVATTLAILAAAAPARAHHGKEFLVVETYELPHPGHLYLLSNQDLVRAGGENFLSFSPGLLVGVTERFAVEVHGHFEKGPGEGWAFEAIAPAVRLQLTRPDHALRAALSGEYEIGRGEAPDNVEGRLIVGYLGRFNVTGNLVVSRLRGTGEGTQVGYAVGVRPAAERKVVLGAEAQGNFRGEHGHEVLAAAYFTPSERVTVKLAAGTGFGDAGPDFTLRTGLVLGF